MENLKLSEIAKAIDGELVNCKEDININDIAIKSWKVKPNDLYIALVEKGSDPSEPVKVALENGAIAVIVPKKTDFSIPQIVVDDTWSALYSLAEYYKNIFNLPTIMITGSSGKTSTKDMVTSVLREKYKVHKTQQNNNSNLGIAYTIFHMKGIHEISVLEVGMDNFGQIKSMTDLVRPEIAIITNIGTAHIQNLKTKENIFKAKMEITEHFNKNNILIINTDDEYLSRIKDKPYKIIKISTCGKGDYNAFDIVNLGEAGVQFKCKYRDEILLLRTNAVGIHNVYNALAAIAVADLFDLDGGEIQKGILKYKSSQMRMNIIRLEDHITLLEDCYNANPDSMKYAIDVLYSFNDGRKIAVLGDMLELGEYSKISHEDIGNYLIDKCDLLVAVGNEAKYIYDKANSRITSKYFTSKEDACRYLEKTIKSNDVILIKASRGMEMEEVVEYLTASKKPIA